ncbi:NAD(P) transhydrogenase subunit alpha [Candidatus Haliotispira prima]|uniref:proton-translocating NAD(P)(+) transhydrogenase n=1 Tax=Candidatus Haliotispira prima TaxID=3034016 RepID=A0ABY8ME32_9SPIO|nr:NAD(P) transhydrogenase subunit alpha [Candidatus Haliotispira prima]
MILGILNESDKRVAVTPEVVPQLQGFGLEVVLEQGAGTAAGFPDSGYSDYGVRIISREEILANADMIPTFNPLNDVEQNACKDQAMLVSRYTPYDRVDEVASWAKKQHFVYSLDMIPRITVAQSADVLSSLASIAGYKAVLVATEYLQRYFPMLTTAAGSIPPCKVLILGAGVAGLQAVATAKRLGAVVEAFDTRAAAKDEVMSLGAKFVEVEGATDDKAAGGYAVAQTDEYKIKQTEAIAKSVAKSDVIIATAQLRGKPAPTLVTREMVETMKPGSIIIDLAAITGGNCELSQNDQVIEHNGVTIIGDSDLSRRVSGHASLLYGKNIMNFLRFMVKDDGKIVLCNNEHEVAEKSCIVNNGQKVYK